MENEKLKIIEFYYSKNIYYLIIYGLSITISSVIYEILVNKNTKTIINASNISFMMSLLQMFGIILYKINKFNSKTNLKTEEKINITFSFANDPINLKKKQKKRKRKKIILLIICSFCECVRYICTILQEEYKDIGYYISGLNLSVILIISLYIFKKQIYLHHYFSIGLIFISDFLLAILDQSGNIIINYLYTQMCHFSDFTFVPLKLCLEKYLMLFLFLNKFKVLFIEGVIQSLIYLIFFVILYFFSNDFFSQQQQFFNHFSENILYYIIFLLSFIFAKFFEILINDSFDPIYIMLGNCYFVIMKPIQLIFFNSIISIKKAILYIITYLMYLIAVMIFSEVIIIDICDLGINTKKNINIRALNDSRSKSIDNIDDNEFMEIINKRPIII